jgi:N-acetylmuramoyl-L-alanine amidase
MVPMLDSGHGGVIDGVYVTPGKRSPEWECGVLYEGEFNRWIVNGVIKRLKALCKPFHNITPELEDISLGERVRRANAIYKKDKSAYLVSIHANAGGGTGWEIFTSPGQTSSDSVAEEFAKGFLKDLPEHRPRLDKSDGDMDKEAKFYVLTKTHGPAILIEVGFMDHKEDYKKLWDSTFREKVIDSIVETILKLYDVK